MQIRKFLLFVMGLLWLSPSYADSDMLVVWLKNGGKVSYALSERPVMRQQQSSLVLKTSKVEVEYAVDNVLKMTFDSQASGLKEIDAASKAGLRQNSDYVIVTGEQPRSVISVYTSGGVLFKQVRTDNQGNAVFSLSEMPQGVYVVKSKNVSSKIIKK
jgi:hypothetical protein